MDKSISTQYLNINLFEENKKQETKEINEIYKKLSHSLENNKNIDDLFDNLEFILEKKEKSKNITYKDHYEVKEYKNETYIDHYDIEDEQEKLVKELFN